MHKVSGHKGSEQHTCVGERQQRHGIAKQIPHVQLHAAFEDQRRKKQYQNHIGRQPIGTVTGLKRRQDRMLNDSEEQAAQDEGHRLGNPQALRQHRDDRGNDEQPNQEFYARGWRHLRNVRHCNCSDSLTNAWRIATRKSTSDLWTKKIHEQSPSNYEADAASKEITHEGVHQISQDLGCDDGNCQSPPPKAALEPGRASNCHGCTEQE